MDKKIDIIIISYNTCDLTLNCIRSIYENANDLVNKVIVVDNNSKDNTIEEIKNNFSEVELIANEDNFGYAKAVNIGFTYSESELVLVSNSDIIFLENSLQELVEIFEEVDDCGTCGPLQLFPNGKEQRSYGDLPGIMLGIKDFTLITHFREKLRKFKPIKKIRKVPYIDGAVMLIARSVFNKVGGFDEDYFFYTEEADFCYRVNKIGYSVLHNPKSKVIHYRGATNEKSVNKNRIEMLISSKALFCSKHLSFNQSKLFMILEVLYSYNLWLLYSFISLVTFRKKKYIEKRTTFKLFGEQWLKELSILLNNKD